MANLRTGVSIKQSTPNFPKKQTFLTPWYAHTRLRHWCFPVNFEKSLEHLFHRTRPGNCFLRKKVPILKLQLQAIFLLELVISLSYCWWNASCQFIAPVETCFWLLSEKMHTFFVSMAFISNTSLKLAKKNREKSSSTLRLIICKLFAFFIHVFLSHC